MSKQETTKAITHPRFSYRIPSEYKDDVDERIKNLTAKINKEQGEDFNLITQNALFLEALLLGLDEIKQRGVTPKDKCYFIEFIEREKKVA